MAVVLLVLAFLDTGILSFLTDLVPEDILLYASLGGFVVCCALAWDVLKDGLVQLTNFTPGSSTLALFAAAFTLADGVTMVLTPLRESAVPFFAPCALVLLFQLIGQYCERASKFQACRTASSVARPYVVTQDPDVLAGKTGFPQVAGPAQGLRQPDPHHQPGRREVPEAHAGFDDGLRVSGPADNGRPPPAQAGALVPVGAVYGVGHVGRVVDAELPPANSGEQAGHLGVALAGWPGIARGQGLPAPPC